MSQQKKLHFIGVGGIGMSGLADVCWARGHLVSGSDGVESPTTQRLRDKGMSIYIGHQASYVENVDVVVYSSAIALDNPERQAAMLAGIPCVPRARLLGELMRARDSVAVAGTHGKTTTSSVLTHILSVAGWSPSFVLGGVLKPHWQSAAWSEGPYMVVEADESDGSFVSLWPRVAIVTNIDQDHMEHYQHDQQQLVAAFRLFLNQLPVIDGQAILCQDDPGIQYMCQVGALDAPVMTYGYDAASDVRITRSAYDAHRALSCYTLVQSGYPDISLTMSLVGQHNVRNVSAAVTAARHWQVPDEAIIEAVRSFAGVKRRFDYCGRFGTRTVSADVFDDYAHHPTEIQATYAAARLRFPDRRLCAVFQPHRYTRTQALLNEFVMALASFDVVVLLPIYAAGESSSGIEVDLLQRALHHVRGDATLICPSVDLVESFFMDQMRHNDVWFLMGAGSIARVARHLSNPLHALRISPL